MKTNKSKYMSYILRHGMIQSGLYPDSEGYVKLSDFLNVSDPKYKLDEHQILEIAASCPKQRFGIKNFKNELYIRSNQGHSQEIGNCIESDKLLKKLSEPLFNVFHGTFTRHIESIKRQGIKRMNRQHIHMAKGLDAVSGKRHDHDWIIYIDMEKAMKDGIVFYESENGVILTEGIKGILPVKYLKFEKI
jgi:2'-phosphotransferase